MIIAEDDGRWLPSPQSKTTTAKLNTILPMKSTNCETMVLRASYYNAKVILFLDRRYLFSQIQSETNYSTNTVEVRLVLSITITRLSHLFYTHTQLNASRLRNRSLSPGNT